MKAISKKTGGHKDSSKPIPANDQQNLKTDFPLSEKDEVKVAEEKIRNKGKGL